MKKNYHCARTYHEVTFYQDGFYRPCSEMFPHHSGLHINSHSLDEFRGSSWLRELQSDLEAGKLRTECQDCISREQEGYGWRLAGNNDLAQRPLGGIKNLMIWLGNLCNADCSMCNSTFSSRIEARLRKNPLTGIDTRGDPWLESKSTETMAGHASWWKSTDGRDRLIDLIKQCDRAKFLGGEPMLMSGVWEILDVIYEHRPNLQVSMTSNISAVTDEALASLSRFKNLDICVSIDALGDTFEWIRHGLSWNVVEANLKRLRNINNCAQMNATTSAHSLLTAIETTEWAEEQRLDINWWNVTRPWVVNIKNLPLHILNSEKLRLQKHLITKKDMNQKKTYMHLILQINRAIQEQQSANTEQLIRYTDHLNSFRSKRFCTDTWKVID